MLRRIDGQLGFPDADQRARDSDGDTEDGHDGRRLGCLVGIKPKAEERYDLQELGSTGSRPEAGNDAEEVVDVPEEREKEDAPKDGCHGSAKAVPSIDGRDGPEWHGVLSCDAPCLQDGVVV